jgi:hypothetical protein
VFLGEKQNNKPNNHPLTNVDFSFYIKKAMLIINKIAHHGKRIKKEDKNQLKLF